MKILKYKGKTEDFILKQIEKEYGERAIVLHTQKEEATGVFKWFKSPRFVTTVAIKDEAIEEITEEKQDMTEEVEADEQAQREEIQKIAQLLKQEKAQERMGESAKDETSYELLKSLQAELSLLHREIGSLKQTEEPMKDSLKDWANEQMMNLGIKKEVCHNLLETINTEDSEQFIRQLYSALEAMLLAKPEPTQAKIIFFVGSTGVGKTTTLAKLTAKFVLEHQKKVVLFTSDTYRIAAVEQLKTYADILGVDIEVIYDEKDLPHYLEKWHHADYILIDTAGRSHKNVEQIKELDMLMQTVEDKQVYLVLNATTTARDVQNITQIYDQMTTDFDLIVTKLDETDEIGNIVNISYFCNHAIRYVTTGQNVPADIEVFDKDSFITQLLGRISNGSSV